MDLRLIKTISIEKNIKLEDLAKSADIKRATFFNYLSGKTSIPAESLKKISDILDIPIARLYEESDYLDLSQANEAEPLYSNKNRVKEIPLIHKFAYSEYFSHYSDEQYLRNLPLHPVLMDPPLKSNYLCFEVRGDSMFDGTYESRIEGDLILVREIKKSQWQSDLTIYNNNFIFTHRTEGVLIARIASHDLASETILAQCLNKQYEDVELSLKDIFAMFYEVKLVGRNSSI